MRGRPPRVVAALGALLAAATVAGAVAFPSVGEPRGPVAVSLNDAVDRGLDGSANDWFSGSSAASITTGPAGIAVASSADVYTLVSRVVSLAGSTCHVLRATAGPTSGDVLLVVGDELLDDRLGRLALPASTTAAVVEVAFRTPGRGRVTVALDQRAGSSTTLDAVSVEPQPAERCAS